MSRSFRTQQQQQQPRKNERLVKMRKVFYWGNRFLVRFLALATVWMSALAQTMDANKCSIIVLLLLNVVEDVEQIYKLYWKRANGSKKFEWVKNVNWKSRQWKKGKKCTIRAHWNHVFFFRSICSRCYCFFLCCCRSERVDPLLVCIRMCVCVYECEWFFIRLKNRKKTVQLRFFLFSKWRCLPLCSCIQFNSI